MKKNKQDKLKPANAIKDKEKEESDKTTPTQSIVKCFDLQRSRNIDKPTSPEYRQSMSTIQTRHTSKKQEDNSNPLTQEEEDTDTEQIEEEGVPETHSGVRPCPQPISEEELEKLSQMEKMEKIISMMNALCKKVTEINISLNHDSDGINTRLTTLQTQKDNDTISISAIKRDVIAVNAVIGHIQRDNVILKGIAHKHNTQLKSFK